MRYFNVKLDFRVILQNVLKSDFLPKYLEIHQLFVDGNFFYIDSARTKAYIVGLQMVRHKRTRAHHLFNRNTILMTILYL